MLPKKLRVLVSEYRVHEEMLRADLQQHYGVDLDRAMAGAHSVHHIACLVMQLPSNARIRCAEHEDSNWTLTDVLLASIINSLNVLIHCLFSSKRNRGRMPELIGPSWMKEKARTRSLPARALPVDELMEILNKPRG